MVMVRVSVQQYGVGSNQGHNFGLKSGGTNSIGKQALFGPKRLGGDIPLASDYGVSESVMSSLCGVRKRFYCNLVSADSLC